MSERPTREDAQARNILQKGAALGSPAAPCGAHSACACVCGYLCARACARARVCVRACVQVRACLHVYVYVCYEPGQARLCKPGQARPSPLSSR